MEYRELSEHMGRIGFVGRRSHLDVVVEDGRWIDLFVGYSQGGRYGLDCGATGLLSP